MGKYNTPESEKKRREFREEKQIYKFDMNSSKPTFSIDTPPPTVSGKLHIGHISSYTQAELIGRYKRMTGHNVFYPMGYDDNGIPTEILVEKELGINIKDIERKDFIEKCLEVNKKYREIYKNLRKKVWVSVDRTRTYATISPEVQQIAQQEFVKLYKKWDIVCKDFPALRCTKNQTTIAQAETEDKEFEEFFNDIAFTLEDGAELIIATTRPEMISSCKAVFANPEDERYQKYFGKNIITPFGEKVPLLADDKAKIDKWTWLVMCCSYGDETDVFWFQKHKLEPKIIIDRYGKMKDTWVEWLDWLKVEEARKKVMEILESQWVVRKRTAIIQSKKISERGKVAVEIIPVRQRFVNVLDKKETLLDLNNKMIRHPEFMKKRSDDWIENLQWDRNISRSRKFGIPIPVRYTSTEEIILAPESQLANGPVDPTSQLPEWYSQDQISRGETLVLDTWFTSGLSPLINQKFAQRDWFKGELIPFDMRPQAHDIIRTWLLYTTLHTYLREKRAPFKNIMMSGYVLASKNEKISKSANNAKAGPEQLIDQRGADAVRYRALWWQLGKDIVFDEWEIKNWQKLVTKLRNASSFVQMMIGENYQEEIPENIYPSDRRIISRLTETINWMRKDLDNYEFGLAKIKFEEFFWRDFCDNYLELVKVRLYKPELFENGEEKKKSGQYTLNKVLWDILRLVAPYLPFITEEIYQTIYKNTIKTESIHICEYPSSDERKSIITRDSANALKEMEEVSVVIEQVRKFKSEKQISIWAELTSIEVQAPENSTKIIQNYLDDIIGITKAKEINFIQGSELKISINM